MKKRAFVRYSKNGKIVPGSLILTGGSYPQGPSTWKEVPADLCCDTTGGSTDNTLSFDFDLSNFKDNLGSSAEDCNLVIRSTITGISFFYDDDNGDQYMISDAGRDMYDDGNALNTNYTQLYNDIKDNNVSPSLNIPYTHTQASSYDNDLLYVNPPMDGSIVAGDSYFGSGSQYFTNMYPGLFIMAASGINGVTEFSITGNLGTDGNGTNFYYNQPTSYIGWSAFYKTNNQNNNEFVDPSVNHIILVKGSTTGVTQTGDTIGAWDDHALLNLTDDNTDIIYVLFSTLPSTPPVTKEQFRTIADMVLSVAAGTDPCNG
jgi:hypothetical protein